jgi:tellurite resistance protein TerC
MTSEQVTYLVFGIILVLALIFDLGLLSKKNQTVTIRQALLQTFFWVALALAFFIFIWVKRGQQTALEYISGYLMEWSLSIDNIFVFILIFSSFKGERKILWKSITDRNFNGYLFQSNFHYGRSGSCP